MASPFEIRPDPSFWGNTSKPKQSLDWLPPDQPAPSDPDYPAIDTSSPKPRVEPAPESALAGPAPRTPANSPPQPGRFRLRLRPDPETAEELVTPEKVKSWASSLSFHLLLLLLLSLAAFSQRTQAPKTLETGLPAGDPFGSDLGQFLTGGQGMDEPLSVPLDTLAEVQIEPSRLTADVPSSLAPDLALSSAIKPPDASRSGGGVALTGTGQAGTGDGFGVAKFGLGGTELVNNVSVKVGNPQFTLIWDTNVDLDLHVLEPGGSHIYFERRSGTRGGELDVDDVDGFGPENIYWGGGLNKGNGPPGEYKWYVHYYGGAVSEFGRGILRTPTRWRVRLKHNGTYKVFEGKLTAAGQQSRVYTFHIDKAPGDDSEGTHAGDSPLERNSFNNPPAQVNDARSGVDLGSFDAPGTEGEMSPARPERENASTPPANPAAPASTPPPARRPGPPRDESSWVILKPDGVGFEARMPDEPINERRSNPGDDESPEIQFWRLDRIEGAYSVAVTSLPPAKASAEVKAFLESEARAQMLDLGGSNLRLRSETRGELPAVTAEFDLPERIVAGGGKAQVVLMRAGRKLYVASAIGTPSFINENDTWKFLRSLVITGSNP